MIDLTGKQFVRLTVISLFQKGGSGRHNRWLCRCICGDEIITQSNHLVDGESTSCGCLREENRLKAITKHGHRSAKGRSSTYTSWQAMIQRCTNPNASNYFRYGAKGTSVCRRWLKSFRYFLFDMGERPKGMTLDRINPFGDYRPSNCRWANVFVQANNKRFVKMVQVGNKLVSPLIAKSLI